MFVHWGPVSRRGTEIGWSRGKQVPVEEYDALYRHFDPTLFDARAWARLAREAGMRYLVLTTKHHDGFCLWPSALTDYDVAATPLGGDGNLLLNVGPMPTGEIEPRQAARLHEIGAWLARHGESVYGTRGGPFLPGEWGASTHRDSVYVHVLRWPATGPLVLPPVGQRIPASAVLGGGAARARQTAGGTEIDVAPADRTPPDTVVRLELDGPAGTLEARRESGPAPAGNG
jgi:hypothetical protein